MWMASENILTILVAIVVVLIWILSKRRFNYFTERDLPCMKLTWKEFFLSFSSSYWNRLLKKTYEAGNAEGHSCIGLFMSILKPCVVALDPATVEKILINNFSNFHDHGFEFDIDNNPLTGHLFNMKGDQWRAMRQHLMPTFTSGKLRGMLPAMEECAEALVKEMKEDVRLRQDTNTKQLYKRYILSVIASCAFGIDPTSIQDPNCQFRRIIKEVTSPNLFMAARILLLLWLPKFSKLFKIKFVRKEVEDFFFNITRQSFEMRKKSGMKRNDFIQLLLELKVKGSVEVDAKDLEQDEVDTLQSLKSQSPTAKLELTDELLTAQAFVFMVGGYDNSGYIAAATNYTLSKHPHVQKRVREEIEKSKSKHGGLNYQSLKEMKLLGACIDESLRLYPPIPYLVRVCTKSCTLPDGKMLEKGTSIFIPSQSLQTDSRYWPNPHDFNPDRFINGESILPGTYLPFGDGPRLCIAQRFALTATKVLLVKIMENFELLPSTKTKEPIKPQFVVTADIEGGFWANFKSLQNQ